MKRGGLPPAVMGPVRPGALLPPGSDSDDEELERKRRRKLMGEGPAAHSAGAPDDMDEEELKVYVAQKKSAAAEQKLLGGAAGGKAHEAENPADLASYEQDMGFKIEPFNTEEERRTGLYDRSGFWVRDGADPEEEAEETDPWLAQLPEPPAKPPAGSLLDAPELEDPVERQEDYAVLLELMQPGETLPHALRRMKPPRPAPAPRRKRQPAAAPLPEAATSSSQPSPPAEPDRTVDFNRMLEAAHRLLDAGVVEIYSHPYEELRLRAEKMAAEARVAALATGPQWEFCWSKDPGADLHGPYTAGEMQAWQAAECFSAERVAYARRRQADMFAEEEEPLREAHTLDFAGGD